MNNDNFYIANNLLTGLIPYCLFNGTTFNYNKDFKENINVNYFENYFKFNYQEIKNLKTPFVYLSVFSNEGVLKISNLHCKNHFEINKYKKTSILMYKNVYEFDVIKEIFPKYDKKIFNSSLINFNSRGWVVLWLLSHGFTKNQITEILNISHENVNKRIFRIKKNFKDSSLVDLQFFIRDSGLIYTRVPSQFDIKRIVRIL